MGLELSLALGAGYMVAFGARGIEDEEDTMTFWAMVDYGSLLSTRKSKGKKAMG